MAVGNTVSGTGSPLYLQDNIWNLDTPTAIAWFLLLNDAKHVLLAAMKLYL